jgi:hypothetical protein
MDLQTASGMFVKCTLFASHYQITIIKRAVFFLLEQRVICVKISNIYIINSTSSILSLYLWACGFQCDQEMSKDGKHSIAILGAAVDQVDVRSDL